MPSPKVRKVTEEMKGVADLTIPFRDKRAKVLTVQPSKKEENTLEKGRRFLRNIHTDHGTIGFEIDYNGDAVTSFNLITDKNTEAALRTQFTEEFNHSLVDSNSDPSIDIEEGQYVGVMEFGFTSDYWYPLKGLDEDDFDKDPFSSILSKMTGAGGSRVSQKIQIIATPVPTYMGNRRMSISGFFSGLGQGEGDSWWESLGSGFAKGIKRMTDFTPYDKRGDLQREFDSTKDNTDKEDITTAQKDQFERLRQKAESPRYAVTIRFVAYGDSKDKVKSKMSAVTKRIITKFAFEGRRQKIKQSLKTVTPSNEAEFKQMLNDAAQRYAPAHPHGHGKVTFDKGTRSRFRHLKLKRTNPMLMSAETLACLFHLPDPDEVNDDTVDWATDTEFGYLSPKAEQPDFEEDSGWEDDW